MSITRWALTSRRNLITLVCGVVLGLTALSIGMSYVAWRAQVSDAQTAQRAHAASTPRAHDTAQPDAQAPLPEPDDAHGTEGVSDVALMGIRGRATAFMREWLDTRTPDWNRRVAPYITDEAARAFKTTNLDAIPTSPLTAVTVTTVAENRAEARAVLRDGTPLSLALVSNGLDWRVYAIAQEVPAS